jgi:mono/diheme cytochrome c family protein
VTRGRLAVLVAAIAGGLIMAGCDASEDADLDRGRALFQQKCGTCHALAQAGTGEGVGPNLDAAFATARADGMDSDTVEGVVQQQIASPREIAEGVEDYASVYMPADIVTGQDAEDVSAYVASVAGVPGAEPPPLGTAEEVFTEQCGGCHTLEQGAPAGTGPNLADSLQGQDAAYIREQIVDPNSKIYEGFSPDVMPQDFEQRLPEKNLNEMVQYLLDAAGGGGGGG